MIKQNGRENLFLLARDAAFISWRLWMARDRLCEFKSGFLITAQCTYTEIYSPALERASVLSKEWTPPFQGVPVKPKFIPNSLPWLLWASSIVNLGNDWKATNFNENVEIEMSDLVYIYHVIFFLSIPQRIGLCGKPKKQWNISPISLSIFHKNDLFFNNFPSLQSCRL